MNHLPAFPLPTLALIADWLHERGELIVSMDSYDGDYVGAFYLIRSLQDLRLLVLQEGHHHNISFTIIHGPLFSLRGIANKDLLEQALQEFPDGYASNTASLAYYPDPFCYLDEPLMLLQAFAQAWGHPIMLGPPSFADDLAAIEADESVIVRCSPGKVSVLYPFDAYDEFYSDVIERTPARYQWIVDLWQE